MDSRYTISNDMPYKRNRAFYWYFLCSNQYVMPYDKDDDDDDDDEWIIIRIQICYIIQLIMGI